MLFRCSCAAPCSSLRLDCERCSAPYRSADPLPLCPDDQDGNDKQDWAEIMPKLKLHMQDGGIRFNAHVADAPQCGPSRSSTLTGRAVHNTKFYINADPDQASFKNYAAVQNQTIGTFLSGAGCELCTPSECRQNADQPGCAQTTPPSWASM